MTKAAVLLLSTLLLLAVCSGQNIPQGNLTPEQVMEFEYNGTVDYFFENYFQFHPSEGTAAGFHQYDNLLEDLSQPGRDAELSFLLEMKQAAGYRHIERYSEEQRADWKLLSNFINARILELQEIRMWQKNPDIYSSSATASIFGLMSRKFAPPADRLKSVIAREQKIPANLAAAKGNLKNPPRVYTEIAIEQMPGIISFFQKDVPEAFKDVTDLQLLNEFSLSNDKVIAELQRYQDFLKSDLLPISKGDFRLGRELYSKKLHYEDMVDISLDRLLRIGYDDLQKNQAELRRVAAQIDLGKTPEQVLAELEQDHPRPDQLLQNFRDTFASLTGFIRQKHIITIPSDIRPIVEETPPFERALTFASMDTPGPYETKATEAFFNVTLPDASWPAEKTKSWMEGFNRGTILSTAIHEAYPGPLRAILVGGAISLQGAQADGLRHQHRGLGALHRADDARRRLWQRRSQIAHWAVAGCAVARRTLHRRHRDAHRQDDAAAGDGFLRQAGAPDRGCRRARGATWYLRSDLPRVHAGQAGNSQAAR